MRIPEHIAGDLRVGGIGINIRRIGHAEGAQNQGRGFQYRQPAEIGSVIRGGSELRTGGIRAGNRKKTKQFLKHVQPPGTKAMVSSLT